MTLIEFLEARITEDEAMAERAIRATFNGIESNDEDAWAHCANPEQRLAECKVKRKIVEWCASPSWSAGLHADYILRLLVLPYVDHPDCLHEWWQ